MKQFIEELKKRTQIESVIGRITTLKRQGRNFVGLCPFHEENTPSFKINIEKQYYNCFGCNAGGDVIKFLQEYHQISFIEAITQLAEEVGLVIPSIKDNNKTHKYNRLYAVMKKAATIYHDNLTKKPEGECGRAYLQNREITLEISKRFRLGMAPDPNSISSGWQFLTNKLTKEEQQNGITAGLLIKKKGRIYDRFRNRILLPVHNITGQIVAFTGRTLDDSQARYINSPKTPIFHKSDILLGLYQQRSAIRLNKKAIIIEGAFDFLSMARHGINNMCSPMGTALTEGQLNSLSNMGDISVILLFDGDKAGLRSMYQSAPLFLKKNIPCAVVKIPKKLDPDSYIKKYGRKDFDKLLLTAVPLVEFLSEELLNIHNGDVGTKFITDLHNILKNCSSPLVKRRLYQCISHRLNIDVRILLNEMNTSPATSLPEEHSPLITSFQMQFSRRIIAFLLHYPSSYSALSDLCFYRYCTDAFSHHIYKVFEKTPPPFDLQKMFCNSIWLPRIEKILSSESIDSKILKTITPDRELLTLRTWIEREQKIARNEKRRNQILATLAHGDLPKTMLEIN